MWITWIQPVTPGHIPITVTNIVNDLSLGPVSWLAVIHACWPSRAAIHSGKKNKRVRLTVAGAAPEWGEINLSFTGLPVSSCARNALRNPRRHSNR